MFLILISSICMRSALSARTMENEIAKIRADLIVIPDDKKQDAVITWLATERMEREEDLKEKGALRAERDMAIANSKKLIIPLTVRDYAVYIEAEFPKIMKDPNFRVPQDVWKDTLAHARPQIIRTYKWVRILQDGKGNDYVDLINAELNKNFMLEKNVSKIDENEAQYKDFRIQFCKSVVAAIDHSNKIAHTGADGVGVKFDMVVFGNVVDKYMTMFYNAMVEKMSVPQPKVESIPE